MECRFKDKCKKWKLGTCEIDNFCMRRYKLDFLFDNSLLPKNRIVNEDLVVDSDGADYDWYTQLNDIKTSINDFVSSGKNLYIYSATPGNGKTSWAIKLIQYYLYNNWIESPLECRALFISVPKYLLELKSNISKESEYISFIKENINSADLVVWDDIATKNTTEFEHEHLFSVIDSRIYDGKSNIYTSNVLDNNLHEVLGGRLASRILNESICMNFNGRDKRGVNTIGTATSIK